MSKISAFFAVRTTKGKSSDESVKEQPPCKKVKNVKDDEETKVLHSVLNGSEEVSAAADDSRGGEVLKSPREPSFADHESEGEEGDEAEQVTLPGIAQQKLLASETAVAAARLAHASVKDYISSATFKKGEKVPYSHLCKTFEKISQTSSRLDITLLLSHCYCSILALTPEDLLPAIYLSVNQLAPAHEGLELGVGDALLVKAIATSSGKTEKHVKELYGKEGDLGIVAQSSRATQRTLVKPQALTLRGVFATLKSIAQASGKDSGKKRVEKIVSLLAASRETEPQFIVRSLQGKLRIGLAEQTVIAALAQALVLVPPSSVGGDSSAGSKSAERLQAEFAEATERLKMVYSEVPSYDIVVPHVVSKGLAGLTDVKCQITLGLPVKPMLAKPTRGISEVLDRFTGVQFTCEFKYDGERAQIHYDSSSAGSEITIYSRNSENHTTKYPDIIHRLPGAIRTGVASFILDCEVVAFDREQGRVRPFQALQHRGRKNILLSDVKVPVCLFAFDLLYLNGQSLLRQTLAARREHLRQSFTEIPAEFQFARSLDSSDPEDLQAFFNTSVQANCEGLMVKTLTQDATYQPSRRTFNWLKIKKDYLKGLGDSLDLVPIGGYLGKGKRTGWYGGFLLACFDEDSEDFQSICKIGTGFSEEMLAKLSEDLKPHIIPVPRPYYRFAEDHRPDVWFADHFVWEVLAADLSVSPAHRAALGKVDPEKGIALRFPRFIRVRDDKTPSEATDASQVAEMYRRQFQHGAQAASSKDNDEY
eukprot:RCo034816